MSNVAHVVASFYLMFNTELSEDEFVAKFNKDVIINSKVEITLPDGSVHSASFADILGIKIEDFEEEEEKATKQSA